MGYEQTSSGEQADWPYIELTDSPEIRELLTAKRDQYDRRIHTGTHMRALGNILYEDYRDRERTHLAKTDAYLKMIYASAVLHEGHCNTAWLHAELWNNIEWKTEFLSIQRADPHKFDELSWNAAEVIKEYATGQRRPEV
jgi:hypothetical protein